MKRYPLTADGVDSLQAELLTLEDTLLLQKAERLAEDVIPWLSEHFELSVAQLEFLRERNEVFLRALGWCFALALLFRQPLRISELEHFKVDRLGDVSLLLEISAAIGLKASHSPSGALSFTIHKTVDN